MNWNINKNDNNPWGSWAIITLWVQEMVPITEVILKKVSKKLGTGLENLSLEEEEISQYFLLSPFFMASDWILELNQMNKELNSYLVSGMVRLQNLDYIISFQHQLVKQLLQK